MVRFTEPVSAKGPSQRQLQVGEEIRHVISHLLMRGDVSHADLRGTSVTVSEVRISPDLKNATAYVWPLGGINKEIVAAALNECAPTFRHHLGKSLRIRHMPKLKFKLDDSYEVAGKINDLLNTPHVAQDLRPAPTPQ